MCLWKDAAKTREVCVSEADFQLAKTIVCVCLFQECGRSFHTCAGIVPWLQPATNSVFRGTPVVQPSLFMDVWPNVIIAVHAVIPSETHTHTNTHLNTKMEVLRKPKEAILVKNLNHLLTHRFDINCYRKNKSSEICQDEC